MRRKDGRNRCVHGIRKKGVKIGIHAGGEGVRACKNRVEKHEGGVLRVGEVLENGSS